MKIAIGLGLATGGAALATHYAGTTLGFVVIAVVMVGIGILWSATGEMEER